ncbi:MAG: CpsB/CapC family capsule biosynthesis tyrosine phosphatase, partial [Thermodesulfobacteriota bacterium]
LDYSLMTDKNLSNYTLNQNGKHLLCELPFGTSLNLAEKLFYPLRLDGYIPILAHVERFISSESEIKELPKLVDLGVLLQVNAASLVGIAGNRTKKIAETLVNSNLVHLVASDAHDQKVRSYLPMALAYNTCRRLAGDEKTQELFEINPSLILEGKSLEERNLLAGIKKESF